MRPFGAFLLWLAFALIVGALLAYPVVALCGDIIDEPMYRVVNRAAMLAALASSPWFLAWLRLNNKRALGYALPKRRFWRALAGGSLAGIAMLAVLVAALAVLGLRIPDPQWAFSWSAASESVLEAALSGVLVGLIEETFFRGAMFSAIDRCSGPAAAAALTALFYAALHFVHARYEVPPGQLQWYSGLVVLGHSFYQLGQPAAIADSALALFAAGALLALVRARTGHIAWCIGLHAGWVVVIKLTKDLSDADYTGELGYLIGHYDGIIGYLALAWIALIMASWYAISATRGTWRRPPPHA